MISVVSVTALGVSLPWQPAGKVEPVRGMDEVAAKLSTNGQFGWHELTEATARTSRRLPGDRRAHTAIVAFSYWQVSAIDQFGHRYGLPRVYTR